MPTDADTPRKTTAVPLGAADLPPADACPQRPASWRRWLLRPACGCLVLGLVLTGIQGGRDLGLNMVYTFAIGMSSSLAIQTGQWLAWQRRGRCQTSGDGAVRSWLGWPLMTGITLLGSAIGYSVGAALGNRLTGQHMPALWDVGDSGLAGPVTISLAAAAAATYMFSVRARLAAAQAQAETARRVAAQTQLKLLESQLEPHMLFNTLANLRALIAVDPPRATAMLDHLIAFLRSTLAASRAAMHPLAAEFDRTADYLALMQVRLGSRLQTTLQLPPALADHPVPPLLLQPLVENAIQHGIEPSRAGGRITLRAERDGDVLVLTVHDSGIGLAPAAADGAGAASAGGGFGTTQVRERLATLYGARAALQLAAAEGGGTVATVVVPWGG